MIKKKITYAIIPSRSGSKRFRNKNIYNFFSKPLFYYSIRFAKKLSFVDKIIFSTDSLQYIKLAKKFPNLIIHKRKKYSSRDNSMEEDVLNDLNSFFKKKKITKPDNVLWLRPTNPLRCVKTFNKAFNIFKKQNDSVLIVHETDSRLFYKDKKLLIPLNNGFKNRSMLRGQDVKPYYQIFSGEFFKYKSPFYKNFLGERKRFVVAPQVTKFDIDSEIDILFLKYLIKKFPKKYKKYLH